MMTKHSAQDIPCTFCENPAIPGTDPAVCEEHAKLEKKSSNTKANLKDLDNK